MSCALGGSWGGTIDPDFTSDSLQTDSVRVSQYTIVPEPAGVSAIAVVAGVRLLSRRRVI